VSVINPNSQIHYSKYHFLPEIYVVCSTSTLGRERSLYVFVVCNSIILALIGKKVKQSHNTTVEAHGERIYSSYSFSTSQLDGGE
jgi:hypothetical protein